MTLGKKIAVLRIRKGMSYNEFADIVGVKRQTVLKWESDKALPKTESLLAISKYFNVSIGDLLNDDLDIFSKEYAMKKKFEAETGVRLTMKETSLYLKQLRENPKMLKADSSCYSDTIESIKDKEKQIRVEDWRYIRMIYETKEAQKREDKRILKVVFSAIAVVLLIALGLYIFFDSLSLESGTSSSIINIDESSIMYMLSIYFTVVGITLLIVSLTMVYNDKKRKSKNVINDIKLH